MSENIRNDVLFGIQNKKSGVSMNAIIKGLKSNQLSLEALGDIIGEAMKLDNEFVMKYLYPKLNGKLPKFLNIYDLDEYIFNKFCLLPGEQILSVCDGAVLSRGVNTFGRVYLTTSRYMISGREIVVNKGPMATSLVGAIVSASISSKVRHTKAAIAKTLSQSIADFQVLEWGYYFLITDAYKIQNKVKKLIYWIDIPTEKKTLNVKFVFTPKKMKGQQKADFLQQRDAIINQLEGLLNKYSI